MIERHTNPCATATAHEKRHGEIENGVFVIHEISPALFLRFQRLIYQESGIWLAPHKTALLCGRLARRLNQFGCGTMAEYFSLVTQPGAAAERQLMLDCITTNETRFFRESQHFEFLERKVFPLWLQEAESGRRARRIRIWSAGCSTGQEPYTIAMVLLRNFKPRGKWDLEVVATDLSTRTLEIARQALYPATQVSDIPQQYLHEYMLRGTEDRQGWIRPSAEVRSLVKFRYLNLMSDELPDAGLFDLIFCRNVMIYFDKESKRKSLNLLTRGLAPEGLLLVGHSENLHGILPGFETVVPTVYSFAHIQEG